MITHTAKRIFQKAVDDYHIKDRVDQPFSNPYDTDVDFLEHLLYRKAWIDTVQWHYEDIIRDPQIDPVVALKLKRQIDASNQERTDMVEYIDSYYVEHLFWNATPIGIEIGWPLVPDKLKKLYLDFHRLQHVQIC